MNDGEAQGVSPGMSGNLCGLNGHPGKQKYRSTQPSCSQCDTLAMGFKVVAGWLAGRRVGEEVESWERIGRWAGSEVGRPWSLRKARGRRAEGRRHGMADAPDWMGGGVASYGSRQCSRAQVCMDIARGSLASLVVSSSREVFDR